MLNGKLYSIILVPFPLTNLLSQKIRPALLLGTPTDSDAVLCAISTKTHSKFDIAVKPDAQNGLKQVSYIRCNKIATIDGSLVLAKLGTLDKKTVVLVQATLRKVFSL
jgi:mRNA-degrading endonuclease toxin of MazEF toxin-antitoxin module